MIKKGEKITLEYQDGFIVTSSKNDKLLKKFENIEKLTREKGVQIAEFNQRGIREAETVITNYDNGKLKRVYSNPNPARNLDNTKK